MKDWTLRYYRDGDELAMLDCLTAAFGRWPGVDIDVPPIDHLRWKLTSDPAAKLLHPLAAARERIVGCQIVIAQRWKVGDCIAPAFLVTDMAVHPDYQGQGMMGALWVNDRPDHRAAVDLLVSISSNRAVNTRHKKLGLNLNLANPVELLECRTSTNAAASPSVAIDTAARFDDRIDNFSEQALQPFSFALVRNRVYMNWRYADRRAGQFTIRLALDGDELLGYAVLRRSGGKAHIADLLVLPGRDDVLQSLLADAIAHFGELGEDTVRCWMPRRHPYRQTVLSRGFGSVREVEGFGVMPMGSRDVEYLAADELPMVHVMPGDTDIV